MFADVRWILDRCRIRFRSALAFSLAFKALNLILLTPLAAGVARIPLSLWGRASIGNFELAAFSLSPLGIASILGLGGLFVASLYLELSGLLRLLADDDLHWWEAFKSTTKFFPKLVKLGLVQVALYLLCAAPFLIVIGLTYGWFWHGKDLNALIIVKPPEFWWGAGIAAVMLVVYGVIAAWLFIRQLHAVPILALERAAGINKVLRTSAERSRGRFWRSAAALVVWFALQTLFASAVLGSLHWIFLVILRASGSSITTTVLATGMVLVIQAVAANLLSILANISFVSVVLSLYRHEAPPGILSVGVPRDSAVDSDNPSAISWRRASLGWRIAAVLAVGVGMAAIVSWLQIRDLVLLDKIEITAHRAGAIAAPENSVAALRQAIADQADWAEIDVQLSADQALVVLHDIDLLRIGGGNRRVDEATLVEIQALDIGTPVGPQFAGERVPTFQAILAAAGDRIRLNVELKPHNPQDAEALARRVVEEIARAKMVSRCRMCSQSYESLQLTKKLEPRIEVGYIVAASVGDPTRLDVDFLMIKSNLATRQFVDRAAVRGVQVHAWTVNDAALVGPLVDAGVANIITDAPAMIRQQLDQIRSLDVSQRLLLRTAHAITE